MRNLTLRRPCSICLLFVLIIGGCAGPSAHPNGQPLEPLANADPEAAKYLIEGNHRFGDHQWTTAIRKYEEAIHVQPSLAEAHYNLALTLDQQGRFSESRPHYLKAADLAPGHPVMWNAPPFRHYGTVEPETHLQAPDGHMGHQH